MDELTKITQYIYSSHGSGSLPVRDFHVVVRLIDMHNDLICKINAIKNIINDPENSSDDKVEYLKRLLEHKE